MGYIKHHTIIVTSWNENLLHLAHTKANQIMTGLVTEIKPGRENKIFTFCIVPDGSKEDWPESEIADKQRTIFINWLNKQRHEDMSSSLMWFEVSSSFDDNKASILRSVFRN